MQIGYLYKEPFSHFQDFRKNKTEFRKNVFKKVILKLQDHSNKILNLEIGSAISENGAFCGYFTA